MSVAPSGRQVTLVNGDQELVVVEMGGGLRSYRCGGVPVLDGYGEDERASAGRGQPLVPWPNRLDGGRYRFDGLDLQAPITEVDLGNAIHGLTRWAPWELVSATTSSAVMGFTLHPQPGWAWSLSLRITYRLGPSGLGVTLAARNVGASRCPFGAGFHPYLAAPTGAVDDMELRVPAGCYWRADDRSLPVARVGVEGSGVDFRSPAPIGDRVLDVAYTDLERDAEGTAAVWVGLGGGRDGGGGGGSGRVDGGRAVRVHLDRAWTHVMVFTGDTVGGGRARQGLAVEPMTGPANLLRSGEDLVVIEPGATWEGTWGITPSWVA